MCEGHTPIDIDISAAGQLGQCRQCRAPFGENAVNVGQLGQSRECCAVADFDYRRIGQRGDPSEGCAPTGPNRQGAGGVELCDVIAEAHVDYVFVGLVTHRSTLFLLLCLKQGLPPIRRAVVAAWLKLY